jgi:hypothetical protein
MEELLQTVFSVLSAPRLHNESIVRCELVQFGSQSRTDS